MKVLSFLLIVLLTACGNPQSTSSEVPNLISSAAPFQIDELKFKLLANPNGTFNA